MGYQKKDSRRVEDKIRRSLVYGQTHGLQAYGRFPGAGSQLGYDRRDNQKRAQTSARADLLPITGACDDFGSSNAGAHVTHVDASKGMVAWAKENAAVSGLANEPCAGSLTTA